LRAERRIFVKKTDVWITGENLVGKMRKQGKVC